MYPLLRDFLLYIEIISQNIFIYICITLINVTYINVTYYLP